MLWFLHDPYSVFGLKLRASKLPDCPYKLFLELTATQLEKKVIKQELISVALKILNLSREQMNEVLRRLESG